jgi:hypothetical protein
MATIASGNLPHFPDEKDEDQRIRMGCPVDGEDLLHRYRDVVCGTSPRGWTDDDYLNGYNFEWALADTVACSACEARGQADCRSVHGRRYFMDMQRKRTQETGKPCFVMTKCESIVKRKQQIRDRMVEYRG